MKNVKTRVEGDRLIIEVKLSDQFGPSGSGKSVIVASTQGNVSIPGTDGVKMGLNIYRPTGR